MLEQKLTEAQRAAVEHFEGPLMVLAGPGSGKTRVITHRILRLLERGAAPDQILALTFTNKAAREMADRVRQLVGDVRLKVTTFHRFCSGLLRRWSESVGLRQNFSILDQSDQVRLVKSIMKEEGLDTGFHDPSSVLSRISRARNELITADEFRRRYDERAGDSLDAMVYQVFPRYQQAVLHQNAVDFDDLLLHVVHLLHDDETLRRLLDQQYRFILVDEYQDTNLAQYEIIRGLSVDVPNLCVTGDPDQSIYGWRGARPENLGAFERDFPAVKVVSLDQNFRSTQSIVGCAEQLISAQHRAHRGRLFSERSVGDPVKLMIFENSEEEADGIAEMIQHQVTEEGKSYSDYAVFYRINSLSRSVETAFTRRRIPFQVASGFSFFERAEIRDLVAYLRLIENQSDDSAFERIVNRPIRGIGTRTLSLLSRFSATNGITLFEAAQRADEVAGLTSRSRKPLLGFVDLIQKLHEVSADGHVAPVLEQLISDIDYFSLWREEFDQIDTDRQANIHELIAAAKLYDSASETDSGEPPSLSGFLEMVSLSNEADNVDETSGRVTLMTIHAAKGLEFRSVFLLGLETGLIPHERAIRYGAPSAYEEERRLLFVGITRAMDELTLTQTRERSIRGMRRTTISSPFVPEIETAITRVSYSTDDPFSFAGTSSGDQPDQRNRMLDGISVSVIPEMDRRLEEAKRRFEESRSQPERPRIMTAAQLQGLLDQKAQSAPAASFVQGMMVRHPRYGRGIVTAVSPPSSRSTITVRFEMDDREETFVAGKCPLQPAGLPPE